MILNQYFHFNKSDNFPLFFPLTILKLGIFVWVDRIFKIITKESKMKKLLVILMVASLALVTVSCQKKTKVEEAPAPVDTTTAVTDTVNV